MFSSSDPYHKQRIDCVQELHRSLTQITVALSGGGSLMLSDLLSVPGGSHTLIEAFVPYSYASLSNYIGRVPEQYCSSRTARNMAMAALYRSLNILHSEGLRKQGFVNPEKVSPTVVDVSHDVEEATESVILRSFKMIDPKADDDKPDTDAYQNIMGVGCTASLMTDREKRGEHRVHIAVQTLHRTTQFSLWFQKNSRSRWEEERLVGDLIFNAIETVRQQEIESPLPPLYRLGNSRVLDGWWGNGDGSIFPVFAESSSEYPLKGTIPLKLKSGEIVQGKQAVGSPLLVDLFFGNLGAVLWANGAIHHSIAFKDIEQIFAQNNHLVTHPNAYAEYARAIFPGSFNPIHKGHQEMLHITENRLQCKAALEISVQNVDKPPVDYIELQGCLDQITVANPKQIVWLTRTPLFAHKAELFRGATFVVGADTLKRFADLRFYQENVHNLHEILREIASCDCRFLVFARQSKHGLETLETLEVPDMLRSLCEEIPSSEFTMNISSTDLRREESP